MVNQETLELVKEFEGLALEAYRCPSGKWTIGYGHTRTAKRGMIITGERAEELLHQDLEYFEAAVWRSVDVGLNENQLGALVSFTYNVGVANFKQSSLLRLLNRGWYDQVPAQLARWRKSNGVVLGGLVRRRAAEGRLWKSPITRRA